MEKRQNFYTQFPTPQLLKAGNLQYSREDHAPPLADNGDLLPFPSLNDKKAIFDTTEYEHVDNFALQISQENYSETLKDFTGTLTASFTDDEMAVVRVIFRWIAAQDLQSVSSHTTDDTVWTYLSKLKANSGYYSEVFLKMCRYAGIHGQLVHGFAKHAKLELGARPKESDVNTWVVVVINGEWRLIDVHWGSCHMVDADPGEWLLIDDAGHGAKNVKKGGGETQYSYNDTYFLTDPQQMIYSHIPKDDDGLQLLARPVTLREFTDMAYLKPAFFELGLMLLQHRTCIIHATNGEIHIQIGTPPGSRRKFMYRLWMSNQVEVDDLTLDRFCIMTQANNKVSSRIYFPKPGKFKFEFFGGDADKSSPDNSLQLVCAFVIHSDKAAEGVKAFPENSRSEWGPGTDMEDAGLTPITHTGPIIEAEGGSVDVRFQAEAKPNMKILHNLYSNSKSKEELKPYLIHYTDVDKQEIVLCATLPENGDYAMNIFAPDAKQPKNFQNVCSYIVSTSNAAADPVAYPDVPNGQIGPHDANQDVKLRLISHEKPLITCPEDGQVALMFDSEIPCETTTTLRHHNTGGVIEIENYVWTFHDGEKISISVHIPESGLYTLCVFAKELNVEGNFRHMYTCVLNAPVPMESCSSFPVSYSQWKPGCQIIEPKSSMLKANSTVNFLLRIPHAHNVSTVDSNNKWTPLEHDDDDVWVGEVETGGLGELKISTELQKGSGTYSTLLKYKVEAEEDILKEDSKQLQVASEARTRLQAVKKQQQDEDDSRNEHFEDVKQDLLEAIESRDLAALQKSVKTIEQEKYVGRLSNEVEDARKLKTSLGKIEKFADLVEEEKVKEVAKQPSPSKGVHEVVQATLVLLGHSQADTDQWPECTKLLDALDLAQCVRNFDVKKLNHETTNSAANIIGNLRLDDVTETVPEIGPMYEWATCVIHEAQVVDPVQAQHQEILESSAELSAATSPETSDKPVEPTTLFGLSEEDAWNILYFICFMLLILILFFLFSRRRETESIQPENTEL